MINLKYLLTILVNCSILFLAGCANKITFIALSNSPNATGNLYKITNNKIEQVLLLPYSNYIIKINNKYFVTSSRTKESKNSAISIVKQNSNGSLTLEEQKTIPEKSACHLTISKDNQFLYIANYSSSSITQIKLNNLKLTNNIKTIKYSGKSITKRQKSSHPHQVYFNPKGDKLFVCDLGCDKIYIYNYYKDLGINPKEVTTLLLAPGSGPRHLVFSKDGKAIFVNCELNNSVVSFAQDKETQLWKEVLTLPTLKNNQANKNNFPGAIKISNCGKYFFVTNRGDDSIAMYKVYSNGKFKLLDVYKVKGRYPSDILLLDNDKLLAVISLKSSQIEFFNFNKEKAALQPLELKISIPKGISLGYL
jgi:6-phosphogluconolactonase